jgi:Mg/Co/Ni transporter MgtE
MTDKENKKMEIVFAPGCFDSFEGTQEELDELIAQIQKMAETGELFEKSNPIDVDQLVDEMSDDEIEKLMELMDVDPEDLDLLMDLKDNGNDRNLQ